ncbi:LysE family translocator [Xanthomonas sp. 3058]|uniref:LysE family translocator n=1 Tax=Xanthomonas sp. 3058 TaxID=3035314 RepID=UPI001616512D|nr:LysE family translocator [Xanthomonas sp. 3058]MBB5862755.1 threonine/homoserine/homoserine lactone efflux protein [Xanthomonas sp. 3058]
MDHVVAMASFALVCSISPGPVNLVALSTGATAGARAGHTHVIGATVGFVALLLVIGLGLQHVLVRWPLLGGALQLAGVAFLLYMAWRLVRDDGVIDTAKPRQSTSFWTGAAMQWLNPKAWLAATSGVALYATQGTTQLAGFAAVYALICYPSLACWLLAGTVLRRHVHTPHQLRRLNRLLAGMLVLSAVYLLLEWAPALR